MYNKITIEESIQLVQEWKASGISRNEFASIKGLTVDQMKYQIRKVRRLEQDSLSESVPEQVEFTPVPQEYLGNSGYTCDPGNTTEQPALMFKSASGCLQVTNQIDPYLLKTAMEVMLSC